MRKQLVAVLASIGLAAIGLTATSQTAEATTSTISARSLLSRIPNASESGASSYVRTKFTYPIDANKDCQDTRAEVLLQETKAPVAYTKESHCVVKTGRWYSYYDGVYVTSASGVQIDHLVPLEQAWVSGARTWTAAQRTQYANDLTFGSTLVAVTARTNLSKGDRDPAHWLPPRAAARCTYAIQWVDVKYRWRLTMDSAERAALANILTGTCGAKSVAIPTRVIGATPGTVVVTPPAPLPVPVPAPVPAPVPTDTVPPTVLPCSASMSNGSPAQNSTTDVLVQTAAAATVTATAHYKSTDTSHSTTADGTGSASVPFDISRATLGYTVVVDVSVSLSGQTGACSTSFTPQ